jgi:hypothetical protein
MLERICGDDPKARDAIDNAVKEKQGNPTGANQYQSGNIDNIQESTAPTGTSSAAALRRLRKDSPALHADVLAAKVKKTTLESIASFI